MYSTRLRAFVRATRSLVVRLSTAGIASATALHAQGTTPPPTAAAPAAAATAVADPRLDKLKAEALQLVEARAKQVQEIVDMLFSFQELGFQEFESQRYITTLLAKEGFTIEKGVAGIPSSWTARWSYGTGKPEISLGSDVDGIPQASNKPGVGYRDPMVSGGPGHGEGHNAGQAVNIVAAIVVKQLMQRDKINGSLLLWPGIAEEQMAGKAFLVRSGLFKNTDVTLFTHVGNDLGVSWGASGSSALLSAEFRFRGSSAHAAGAPWSGKSALDAVMLMGQGWEYKREHLRLQQRSHYVIKDGGDQPNVVPSTASIWFYFREQDYPRTMALFEVGKKIAEGAAMMTDTKLDTIAILGSGWSAHFSKPIAEAMHANVQTKDVKYQPFIRPQDTPPTYLNADIMARYKSQLQKFYYDPTKFKTYLEQLGIEYPTVRAQVAQPKGQ